MSDTHVNRTEPRMVGSRQWAVHAALAVVAISVAAALAGQATWAAYSATTTNAANTFATGTVTIADNDGGTAMFALTGLKPPDTASRCIKVTYTGSVPATVRLYGTTAGTGLDAYLTVTITRGVYSGSFSAPSFPSCSNFSADSTNHLGLGAGVIYQGTLADFADDYTTGLIDPRSGAPETWTANESHVYRVDVTVQDDTNSQAKSATQTFRWEARSS